MRGFIYDFFRSKRIVTVIYNIVLKNCYLTIDKLIILTMIPPPIKHERERAMILYLIIKNITKFNPFNYKKFSKIIIYRCLQDFLVELGISVAGFVSKRTLESTLPRRCLGSASDLNIDLLGLPPIMDLLKSSCCSVN